MPPTGLENSTNARVAQATGFNFTDYSNKTILNIFFWTDPGSMCKVLCYLRMDHFFDKHLCFCLLYLILIGNVTYYLWLLR